MLQNRGAPIIIFFLMWISSCYSSDFFINGTFYKSINSPSIRLDDMHFNVSARVVLADPVHGCGPLKNPDAELQGSILMITSDTGAVACRMYQRIQRAAEAGCVGLIYNNGAYGGGHGFTAYYINWDVQRHHLTIPAVEIPGSNDLIKKLKDPSLIITVDLVNGDNGIGDAWRAWVGYSVVMGGWSLLCAVLSGYKLKLFIDRYGFQYSVPQACLIMLTLSALFRVIGSIDPPYTRGLYPWFVTGIFDLLEYPLVLCSALLIAFYWEDAMRSASVHSIPTLHKMKKPFYISAIVLMTLASITVLLRGLNTLLNLLDVIIISLILIFSSFITAFYSWESYQVLSRLYKSTSVTRRQSTLYRMTMMLVGSVFFMVSYEILLILHASLPFTVKRFAALRFLLCGTVNIISNLHTLAFQNPRGTSSANSSEITTKKPTTAAEKDIELSTEPSVDNL